MMQLEGQHLSIEEVCAASQVSGAGYYWYFDEHAPRQSETELRDQIQRVALESFIKTLKAEEVSLKQYRNIEQPRRSIGHSLEEVYNQRRLHSALEPVINFVHLFSLG
jgi:transposase InsO family protein